MRPVLQVLASAFVVMGCANPPIDFHPVPETVARWQTPTLLERDGQGLAMTPLVYRQLVHLLQRGINEQKEPSACVSAYKVWKQYDTTGGPGAANAFTRNIDLYALTVSETDSSNADSVWSDGGFCPKDMPWVHGHIWRGQSLPDPSGTDRTSLRERSAAPFAILIYIAPDSEMGVKVYWR